MDEAVAAAAGYSAQSSSSLSIGEHYVRFREQRRPTDLLRLILAIASQGRLPELVYSAWLTATTRPSEVARTTEFDAAPALAAFGNLPLIYHNPTCWPSSLPSRTRLPAQLEVKSSNVIQCGNWDVLGEYAHRGARLIFLCEDRVLVDDHYSGHRGVRHIHALHRMSETEFLVTTGDAAKRVDLWSCAGDRPRFVRNLMRWQGGFTGAVRVAGRDYFGSDYSGRPNYLLRWQDRARFPLPAPAYRMYCESLHAWGDHFVACVNRNLEADARQRWLSMFDTRSDEFVACEPILLEPV
jgi:hypothetical protein